MPTAVQTSPKSGAGYQRLREAVKKVLLLGQQQIEAQKVQTYWQTGQLIQKHVLQSKDRAGYGRQVILKLSGDLDVSDSVLRRTVQFYNAFPISAPARKLTWAHYCEILPVEDKKMREDLVIRAEKSEWTRDDLRRKLRAEFRPENNKSSRRLQEPEDPAPYNIKREPPAPLKAKPGTLYTYRLVQPDQIHEERPYLLIDLGFTVYQRLYKTDFKAENIIQSVWVEAKEDYQVTKSAADEIELYTYQAIVERVVDADTLLVKVDLGFDTWTRQYLRLRGIDCSELATEEGRKAKRFVEKHLADVPYVLLKSSRSDKYDRYLADVWILSKSAASSSPNVRQTDRTDPPALWRTSVGDPKKAVYLNQLLLDGGHAVRY